MDDFAHIVGEDVHFRGRSPSGERGLKSTYSVLKYSSKTRRSPSGERGLKSSPHTPRSPQIQRRSPSGERGFLCRINTLVDVGIVPSILDIRICDGGNDISLVPLVNV